jgi:hypothetical protein
MCGASSPTLSGRDESGLCLSASRLPVATDAQGAVLVSSTGATARKRHLADVAVRNLSAEAAPDE